MIELMNDRMILIDSTGNMIQLPDLTMLYNNMKVLVGDVPLDKDLIEPTEDIYDYIIEKIYLMPEYTYEMSFKSFNDNPKEKLLIAFNKFLFDMIETHETTTRHTK